jgi:predicted lactoylglutathione lyase
VLMEFPASVTGTVPVAGIGADGKPFFWISAGGKTAPHVHLAFRVESRAQVDAFHAAAIAAGGKDNGGPGIRELYHPNYYGAFILDPDGHNLEAVSHKPE